MTWMMYILTLKGGNLTDYNDYDKVIELLSEAQSAEQDNREWVREDRLFVSSPNGQWEQEQWESNVGSPRYSFDQTTPIIDQIAGQIDRSDFDINIAPANGEATKEYATLRSGIIRNIERLSEAKHVYARAGREVVTTGLDHWMVTTDYVDDNSFDKDLLIKPIFNSAERVWFDVAAQRQDREDSNWGFLLSVIPQKTFDEKYPDRTGCSVSQGKSNSNSSYYNIVDNVVIGHFFYRKLVDRKLGHTSLGRDVEMDGDVALTEGETIVEERTRQDSIFCMRKFDGQGWLSESEETVFSTIPIVPCYGNYEVIENKPLYHGVVQKLKDPQRVLNYSLSREVAEGALAPRAKYWMTKTQAKGHTATLASMNTNNDPVQLYNHDPDSPGAPQQNGGAQINPGLRVISDGMQDIMGRTAGIFAVGMGENPGLQSGAAIGKLQDKSNNVTSKFFTALEISICRTAKILNDAIPKVYDTQRQLHIVNGDGSIETKVVNEVGQDGQILEDLSKGKYSISCSSGPSYDNQQSAAVAAITELARYDPSILQTGSDVLLNNISAPGVDKIAARKRQELFMAGVIPEEQMTEEERAKLQQMQQQPQQPDAMMVMAQAEQAKADMQGQKNQIQAQKDQMDVQFKMQQGQLSLQKQELEFAEKQAKFGLQSDNQQFNQMLAIQNQQQQQINDAVARMNTAADTLKKLSEAGANASEVDQFDG
jgi:hypothetical protein